MRIFFQIFCYTFLILLFLNGCSSSSANEDIFQYKGTYVGNNSSIGNIVERLPNANYFKGFALKTEKEPYGIMLNYDGINEDTKIKETVIYNATFIFTLVQNVDWIAFDFNGQTFTLTKKDLEDWYDEKLSRFTSEADLTKLTQKFLEDEIKTNQLLTKTS
ncbi:DUF4825 domain-containing protein [Bacillus sp. HMF5848]|uniref:DUF4825 domain-containing protein n=1 Tax=Bacillus sp. HMF5848 TaxID=2495421 RepID=UPI000F766178|nr:DUF4825 domain-containing protein [Bacillus sp. HMF5848]RSK27696.1 DUF4825 domain-containing protein [Bacillus sp. HMF5848]